MFDYVSCVIRGPECRQANHANHSRNTERERRGRDEALDRQTNRFDFDALSTLLLLFLLLLLLFWLVLVSLWSLNAAH